MASSAFWLSRILSQVLLGVLYTPVNLLIQHGALRTKMSSPGSGLSWRRGKTG